MLRLFLTICQRREMKAAELRRCSIQNWYPSFKSHTIKTLFHPLPDSFIRYILGEPLNSAAVTATATATATASDDESAAAPPFLLPRSATGNDPLPRNYTHLDPISSLSLIDSDSDTDSDSPVAPSFPDLESAVARSIADLGGAAFPKLNWSAPKDAAWISFDGTLCCRSFADVALLLRSSDAAIHDLAHALPSCSDTAPGTTFYLALRKWYPSFHPDMEFRCFVRHHRLIAISQREVTGFYPQLLDRRDEIEAMIQDFFDGIVKGKFESADYTFDVYVTRDGRVKLVDFNPWGAFTLPLLFEWEELEGFGDGGVEFRVVDSQCGVRPGLKTAVPYDYLDMSEGSGWDQFLKRVDEEQRAQNVEESCV